MGNLVYIVLLLALLGASLAAFPFIEAAKAAWRQGHSPWPFLGGLYGVSTIGALLLFLFLKWIAP